DSGDFEAESDGTRRFAFTETAREHAAGACAAGVFGAEHLRESKTKFSGDDVLRKNAGHQHVLRRKIRRVGAAYTAVFAENDAALPVQLPQSAGIEPEDSVGRDPAVPAAHAGVAVRFVVGSRHAGQPGGCVQRNAEHRRPWDCGHGHRIERELPAVPLPECFLPSHQEALQLRTIHPHRNPGAISRYGFAQLSAGDDDAAAESDSFAGAILWRRGNFAARIRAQPGGAARRNNGVSGGRPGAAGAEPGVPVSDEVAVYRNAAGGNVYSRLRRVTLRWSSPRPVFDSANPTICQFNCTNELNYFSHTVGFGI